EGAAHAPAEQPNDQQDDGNGDQRQQSERRVEINENSRDAQQHRDVDNQIGDVVSDQRFDVLGVVDHTRHDFAGLLVAVVAKRKLLQVFVNGHAQIADVIPCHDVRDITAHVFEKGFENVGGQEYRSQAGDKRHTVRLKGIALGDQGN